MNRFLLRGESLESRCCPSVTVFAEHQITIRADLDGDGDLEIQAAGVDIETAVADSVFTSDLDDDGDLDVIASGAGAFAWYENTDGNGTFGEQRIIATRPGGWRGSSSVFAAVTFVGSEIECCVPGGPSSSHLIDLDVDGDLDLFFGSIFGVFWFENTDDEGRFSGRRQLITVRDQTEFVYPADLDADGDLDILAGGRSGVAWFRNRGGGVFDPRPIFIDGNDSPEAIFAADLDGDADLDVISVSRFPPGNLSWYENTGPNIDSEDIFGDRRVNAADGGILFAEDLDSDGDQDVVLSGTVFWNDGTGRFGNQTALSSNSAVFHVADLDKDGDVDLITSDKDGFFKWMENDGEGNFSDVRGIDRDLVFVTSADLDGDGDVDVVGASSRKVFWYENIDGAGIFGSRRPIAPANGVVTIHPADIDGDGDLDLLVATTYQNLLVGGENRFAWYENRPIGDSNDDGVFDNSDLITVFTAGKFENGSEATFDEGDWNQDGLFNSADLVLAFQTGHYVAASTPMANQLAAAIDHVLRDNEAKYETK